MNRSTKGLRILIAVLIVSTGIFIQSLYVNRNIKLQATIKPKEITVVNHREEVHYLIEEKIERRKLDALKVKTAALQLAVAKSNTSSSLSRGGLKLGNNNSTVTAKPTNSTSTSKTDYEKDLFSRLVNAEAGGESLEGKLAVATVLMNRVNSGKFPDTIKGVIYDENWGVQFTPTLDGRINNPASNESIKAVNMVLDGYRSFNANILYFLNPETADSPWIIKNKVFFRAIENHEFYY